MFILPHRSVVDKSRTVQTLRILFRGEEEGHFGMSALLPSTPINPLSFSASVVETVLGKLQNTSGPIHTGGKHANLLAVPLMLLACSVNTTHSRQQVP